MKRWILVCSLVLACSFSAKAQDSSKVDVFGGYSYLRFQVPNAGLNGNGGSGQVTYNFNPMIGFTGDFGGYHLVRAAGAVRGPSSPTCLGRSSRFVVASGRRSFKHSLAAHGSELVLKVNATAPAERKAKYAAQAHRLTRSRWPWAVVWTTSLWTISPSVFSTPTT